MVVRSPNLLKPLGPTDVRQGMSGVSRMQHVAVGQVLNLLDGRTIRQPTKISRTCEAPPPYIPDNGYIESFNGRMRDELLNDKSASFGKSPGGVVGTSWRSTATQASPAPRDETDGLASNQ